MGLRVLKLAFLASLLIGAREVTAEFGDYRALFVNRFEYNYTTSSIDTIFQNAAGLGITDVMFQVRGRADAFYDSNFEPRANGLSPSFDPLQTAIDAAHSRGIKLHAWLNATPMWNTTAINPPAGHIYHNNSPSFRLTDINGNVEPQDGWSNYSSVNPVLPEVHTHINNVVNDISTNYAVDGIHFDYIRYIPGPSFSRLPHDPLSHQMFLNATGLDGSNVANASAYRDYVKGRITDLVASVKQTVDTAEVSTGRTVELTASVWRDPDVGASDYMQDYRTWLEQDLLDVAMPMIYLSASNDGALFNPNLLNTLRVPTSTRVAPTLGVYLHTSTGGGVDLTKSQIDRAYLAGTDGISFYGYSAMFNEALSSQRRAAVLDYFAQIAAATPGNILDDFEVDEGHFSWPYNHSPTSQTFGLSSATTIDRVTTESQAGIGSQELSLVDSGAGTWQLRHNSGIGVAADAGSNVSLPATGYIGFWLKTADSGMTVQISLDDPGTGELGFLQEIKADDQWHLYQWNLEDDRQWDGWAGGDGDIDGPFVTIDSILFQGDGDATIYLDSVTHNPAGLIKNLTVPVIPGDFDGDGDVDGDDLTEWQAAYGNGASGDADLDGDTDGRDFLTWQRNYTGSSPLAAAAAVPEPSSLCLGALALGLGCLARRRSCATTHAA